MKVEGVAILILLVFGIGLIGMLSMSMFNKMPTSTDEQRNKTVQEVAIPLVTVFGKGLTALDMVLIIGVVIGGVIVFYRLVYQ